MDSGTMTPWPDLPKELVGRIGKFLDTHIDVLRFRAVCSTWRSSIPPFETSPSFSLPLKVPFPNDPNCYNGNPDFYLIESIVYLFQPPDDTCRGWLVKVIKAVDGKSRILHPLTHDQIEYFPDNMPKVLSLLDFRVSQVCKTYQVQYVNPSDHLYMDPDYDVAHNGRKVSLSPRSLAFSDPDFYVGHIGKKFLLSTNDANGFSLMGIDIWDRLCYFKLGDDKWTKLKGGNINIGDIIVYKGNFHAVDRYGETVMFDSSLIETKVASSLCDGGSKKRLVESNGQLFLVDMFLDIDNKGIRRGPSWLNVLEIKMYRLDEEQHEWIEVHTLGDRIFFAGDDCCFSVSAQDFGDCRGNCIYYGNGSIRLDILGGNFNYDDSSEDDFACGSCCRFGDDYSGANVGSVNKSNISNDDDKNEHGTSNDDDKNEHGIGNDDDKNELGIGNDENKNEHGSKSVCVLSEELVHRYKGLHGHNTGIFTIEDGKLGSLLSFLEYADIFWPPPSWLIS